MEPLALFIETPIFTKKIQALMPDEEYACLQAFIARRPQAGDRIPHAGGLRKLRWSFREKGKRGGIRVIYYLSEGPQIYMIYAYSKAEQKDLTSEQIKILSAYVRGGVL